MDNTPQSIVVPQDQPLSTPPQNTSSNTVPAYSAGPETMPIVEITPSQEQGDTLPEKIKSPEAPMPEALRQPGNNQTITTIQTPTVSPADVVKAVTKEPPKVQDHFHHIQSPANPITQLADTEEEDFISHVDQIHSIK